MSIFKEVAEKCNPLPAPMTEQEKQKINDQNYEDLREIAHWYGGWDELRKIIDVLEDNDKDAAWERHELDKLK